MNVLSSRFGVTGNAEKWFSSYLQDRKFAVEINNTLSKEITINYSVPQGSILGPTFFSRYSSTLGNVVKNKSVSLWGYADDNTLLDKFKAGKVDDELTVCTNMESLLSEVKDWMSLNWLKMNDTKTEFIYFGFPKQLEKAVVSEMSVGDSVVQRSNSIKLLGFILDSSLNCKDHIKSKCGIVVCNIHRIRKISRFLSLESGKILASALVLAHFEYGNSLFAGLPNSSLRRMQLI